jgi:hypothetical protein
VTQTQISIKMPHTVGLFLIVVAVFIPMMSFAEQCPKYNRNDYGGWIDADGDCQRTRTEVLIEESVSQVTFRSSRNCKVVSGKWNDPFSGRTFTDPSMLDIDHVVPLKEAHESGAWKWNRGKKHEYANYLRDRNHLMAVYRSENRSKGYKDPAEWLPSNSTYRKTYARTWIEIKNRWGLTADSRELDALRQILGDETGSVYPRQAEECTEVAERNPFAAPASVATDPLVKKSKSGICHDQSSRWYNRTKDFTTYDSLEDCVNSGGRLPKR